MFRFFKTTETQSLNSDLFLENERYTNIKQSSQWTLQTYSYRKHWVGFVVAAFGTIQGGD